MIFILPDKFPLFIPSFHFTVTYAGCIQISQLPLLVILDISLLKNDSLRSTRFRKVFCTFKAFFRFLAPRKLGRTRKKIEGGEGEGRRKMSRTCGKSYGKACYVGYKNVERTPCFSLECLGIFLCMVFKI